jgi:exodeoxyribonuclease V alpha subunit
MAGDGVSPGLPADLLAAAELQDLGEEVLHLAAEVAALGSPRGGAPSRPLLLLALAALAAERAGSTRVPLAGATLGPFLRDLGATPEDLRAVEALLGDVRRGAPAGLSRVIGRAGEYRPLVLAGEHLYTQRAWHLEGRVAANLRALLTGLAGTPVAGGEDPLAATGAPRGEAVDAALADVLARPPRDGAGRALALSAEQQEAVRLALGGRLAVVTGGPGTGKTWVVAALLRVVARLGEPPLSQVALAAPTGKAADRIRASVVAALEAVREPADADLRLQASPPPALTLHRLLSYSPAGERYRHHERNPLAERLVIVDESSMMDLALADHLLRSLPRDGRLVLLGDARQLPSVEAGAVLRELVAAPAARPRVARLRHSWRMDAGDPTGRAILGLAGRVAAGDLGQPLEEVLAVHADPAALDFTGAALLRVPPASVPSFLERWWEARVRAVGGWAEGVASDWEAAGDHIGGAQAQRLASLLRAGESSRLLTATRGWSQGTGAAAVNAWCRAALLRDVPAARRRGRGDEPVPGEPVMVTRNDYRRGLYNGDQGVAVWVHVDGGATSPGVAFRAGDGFRVFPLAALRGRLEPAWATTVHKAQGSEHDVVALLLPPAANRLLTRELLYTAVTRARRGVVLVGSEEALRHAAGRAAERWSGLGEALGDAAADAPATAPAAPRRQLALPF